jgi:hypothetical protein
MIELPGVIDAAEAEQTGQWIASLQLASGMVPWFTGGHCDPWNHIETAMALDVVGMHERAERAYEWLRSIQRPDGSWHAYYVDVEGRTEVEDPKLDTNITAYISTGVWHHWLMTGDRLALERWWPMVDRALEFVLGLATPRGEIIWARHIDGKPWSYALLTGCSSITHSLRCGLAIAEVLNEERHEWELAAVTLGDLIRTQPEIFEPKKRWAMDWYYPVLSGAFPTAAAQKHLDSKWDTFVMDGLGVRCVSDEPWVTAAETAECAIACAVAGWSTLAVDLLSGTRAHRCADGSYLTGIVHPTGETFPENERSAYTAAAVILAADALSRSTAASGVLVGDELPAVVVR